MKEKERKNEMVYDIYSFYGSGGFKMKLEARVVLGHWEYFCRLPKVKRVN